MFDPVTAVLPFLLRLRGAKRTMSTPERTRAVISELALRPEPFAPPRKLRRDVRLSMAYRNTWPVYVLEPASGDAARHVVYLHGGSWIRQIHPLQWSFVANLVADHGLAVTVPIYPLVPFATAQEVVTEVAAIATDLVSVSGADRVALMGDSAGGQIVLSAALLLREQGVPPLSNMILISPALDLHFSGPEIEAQEKRDPWLSSRGLGAIGELWRGDRPLTDPIVSPLFADHRGLGPVALFIGDRDILYPQARALHDRLRASGVRCSYFEQAGGLHVYPILPGRLGKTAARQLGDILRDAA